MGFWPDQKAGSPCQMYSVPAWSLRETSSPPRVRTEAVREGVEREMFMGGDLLFEIRESKGYWGKYQALPEKPRMKRRSSCWLVMR